MGSSAWEISEECTIKELKGRFRHTKLDIIYEDGVLLEHPVERGYHFYCEFTGRDEYFSCKELALLEKIE